MMDFKVVLHQTDFPSRQSRRRGLTRENVGKGSMVGKGLEESACQLISKMFNGSQECCCLQVKYGVVLLSRGELP